MKTKSENVVFIYLLNREPNAFVRPSPSQGYLGGIAQHTNDVVLLCEAGGYDIVIVEVRQRAI